MLLSIPEDILVNILLFLKISDIFCLLKINKELNVIFKNILIENTKIYRSENMLNKQYINSYLYDCCLLQHKKNLPYQLKNGFVELLFDNNVKIIIYEDIYTSGYNIFDYMKKMKRYRRLILK
jgi:hypothetical protein